MAAEPAKLLFLDTSIQIARLLHGPAQRENVERQAKPYLRVSGLVCRQEFKRRVLQTAEYLLRILTERKGYENTHSHMTRLAQYPYQKRRATICLNLLASATGKDDRDKTDRLKTKLRTLIMTGLSQFDGWLDAPPIASQCGCGRMSIRELTQKDKKIYEFGGDRCERLPAAQCGIVAFLQKNVEERNRILIWLQSLMAEQKTTELADAQQFLEEIATEPDRAFKLSPCLKVGDIVIALESAFVGARLFYTMNGRESQHLCRPLGQTMIIRPVDPLKPDVVCLDSESNQWPSF